MKPQLATDWDEKKLKFPLILQPKIDGVRGLKLGDKFTGRSLKTFANKALTAVFSHGVFTGVDGELAYPGGITQPRLCSLTTGLTLRIDDPTRPEIVVFDHVTPETVAMAYRARMQLAWDHAERINDHFGALVAHKIEAHTVHSLPELLEYDTDWLDKGYEGSITRNPDAFVKEGRATGRTQELWRIKRFIDCEARVLELVEAQENQNVAKVNELGRSERSSHQENKVGKGMVGSLRCVFEQDVVHDGEVLFPAGLVIMVGPGEMTHEDRVDYWNNPGKIVNHMIKLNTFPQGVKDKPRFPTFVSIRAAADIS